MPGPRTFTSLTAVVVTLTLLGGGAGSLSATAQQTVQPSSSISGRVVDASTGAPIADVQVTLLSTAPPPAPQMRTGADGRFSFPNLAPGPYVIGSMKDGYENTNFGNAGVAIGSALPLGQADRIDVVIRMRRPGAISGTVLEQDGQPAIKLAVTSLRRQGTRWLPATGATSDDRGSYRMVASPGEYLVVVDANSFSNTAVLHTTYAPSAATRAAAVVVKVGSGEAVSGVDIRVDVAEKPGVGRRIAGTVSSPDGNVAGLDVRLTSAGAGAMTYLDMRTTKSDAQGRFAFQGVPEGDYVLQTVRFPTTGYRTWASVAPGGGMTFGPGPDAAVPLGSAAASQGPSPAPLPPTMTGTQPVIVGDRDHSNVDVRLVSGAHIRGRVVFDEAGAPADLTRVRSLVLPGIDAYLPSVPQTQVNADGTFQSVGLPPGRYRVGIERGFPGWTLASIESGGKDVTSQPVELGASDVDVVLTYTKKVTALVGTVKDAQGRPVPSGRVYLFPQSTDRRVAEAFDAYPAAIFLGHTPLVLQTASSPSGPFEFRRVVPGDYFVAYASEPPEDWMDPAFLRSLEGTAVRVHINLGEAKTVEVRATAVR